MTEQESVSIKKAIDDLMQTHIFKELAKQNDPEFTRQLALWLIRYILVLVTMKSSFKISFEETLLNLHGESYQKIIEVTNQTFQNKQDQPENDNTYIQ
ncbi:MAG: hypothetical protein MUC80_03940 [Candidatus Thermoplasmatota archaeon]|jgi:hypothetical protein|nr:hypothetical protein [Candidatus Thermoplasmatota archaeon]